MYSSDSVKPPPFQYYSENELSSAGHAVKRKVHKNYARDSPPDAYTSRISCPARRDFYRNQEDEKRAQQRSNSSRVLRPMKSPNAEELARGKEPPQEEARKEPRLLSAPPKTKCIGLQNASAIYPRQETEVLHARPAIAGARCRVRNDAMPLQTDFLDSRLKYGVFKNPKRPPSLPPAPIKRVGSSMTPEHPMQPLLNKIKALKSDMQDLEAPTFIFRPLTHRRTLCLVQSKTMHLDIKPRTQRPIPITTSNLILNRRRNSHLNTQNLRNCNKSYDSHLNTQNLRNCNKSYDSHLNTQDLRNCNKSYDSHLNTQDLRNCNKSYAGLVSPMKNAQNALKNKITHCRPFASNNEVTRPISQIVSNNVTASRSAGVKESLISNCKLNHQNMTASNSAIVKRNSLNRNLAMANGVPIQRNSMLTERRARFNERVSRMLALKNRRFAPASPLIKSFKTTISQRNYMKSMSPGRPNRFRLGTNSRNVLPINNSVGVNFNKALPLNANKNSLQIKPMTDHDLGFNTRHLDNLNTLIASRRPVIVPGTSVGIGTKELKSCTNGHVIEDYHNLTLKIDPVERLETSEMFCQT